MQTQLQHRIIQLITKQQLVLGQIRLKKLSGGQINHVYAINDCYVIKVEKQLSVMDYQADIMKQAYENNVKVPKVYSTGFDERIFQQGQKTLSKQVQESKNDGKTQRNNYIIMDKLQGQPLSRIYNLYQSQSKKQLIIKQICTQLQILHSFEYDHFWINGTSYETITQAFDSLDMFACVEGHKQQFQHFFQTESGQKYRKIIQQIKQFYHINKNVLEEEKMKAVMVHNDLHFSNILANHQGELIGIIDFDFTRKLPADYELFRILAFFLKPEYYVEQENEKEWENRDFRFEAKCLKQFYPKLFMSKYFETKMKIYFIEQMMNDFENQCFDAFQCWYNTIYGSNWLQIIFDL